MSPRVETCVWMALRGRLEDLSFSPALSVAWPNQNFTPSKAGYLRAYHTPTSVERMFIGSDEVHRRRGLFLVNVMWPQDVNAATPYEIAGAVAEHFPTDLEMTFQGVTVRVMKAPEIRTGINDDSRFNVPVVIDYEVFA